MYSAAEEGQQAEKSEEQPALSQEQQESDERAKDAVKKFILDAGSLTVALRRAKRCIKDEWLTDAEELPGNIYLLWAFGGLNVCSVLQKTREQDFNCSKQCVAPTARIVGSVALVSVQAVSMPFLAISLFTGYSHFGEHLDWGLWRFSTTDWETHAFGKILAILMSIVLSLNYLFAAVAHRHEWRKTHRVFRYLKSNAPNLKGGKEWVLHFGAIINIWVLIWSSVATFALLGPSTTPYEVLSDALAMYFVFNLDDFASSEASFFRAGAWPGPQMGWIYEEMVEGGKSDDVNCATRFTLLLYNLAAIALLLGSIALPVLIVVTSGLDMLPESPHG